MAEKRGRADCIPNGTAIADSDKSNNGDDDRVGGEDDSNNAEYYTCDLRGILSCGLFFTIQEQTTGTMKYCPAECPRSHFKCCDL